jgi:uncharacterized protein involved in response to NO
MKPLSSATLKILEQGHGKSQGPAHGMPLLRLGFRPFYLCAAAFGAIAPLVWVAVYLGWVDWAPTMPPLLWHAHEMLFGFVGAVIVGFLLTAGKAWTGEPTPRGAALGALALLWLSARLAAVVAPYGVYAVLDLALLPLIAILLLRLLLRTRSYRNIPIAGLLMLLASTNLVFHLSVLASLSLNWVPSPWFNNPLLASQALQAALALVVVLESVIGGRVIPGFAMSANPGLVLKKSLWLVRLTLASTVAALAFWVLLPSTLVTAVLCAVAALCHALSLWRWQPAAATKRPILLVLFAGYVWIPIGFLLLAASAFAWVPGSAGVHSFALGATGGLIIAMMTRTARGHTGRILVASRPERLAYALVMVAALARVVLPLFSATLWPYALVISVTCWSAAFFAYLAVFAPWLFSTRVDGKDG